MCEQERERDRERVGGRREMERETEGQRREHEEARGFRASWSHRWCELSDVSTEI